MRDAFRILFVDDEETFLCSTVDLLRREGYECDSALDVSVAHELLAREPYDLVIADIKMPGNADLEFVRGLRRSSDALSVILVTGHPSITSAVQSVELPVVGYLVKPFDFRELLQKVQATAQRTAIRRLVRDEIERSREYSQGLAHIEEDLAEQPRTACDDSLQALVGMTLRRIVDGLSDLHRLVENSEQGQLRGELMHWKPAVAGELRDVLRDTVATLERTRTAFKSKELGDLRKRLEELLNL